MSEYKNYSENEHEVLEPLDKKQPLTWEVLNQRHAEYDATRVNKLKLLLNGDYEIINNAKEFMPKWKTETNNAYHDRLSFATYENNFGNIINDLSSTLFSKPVSVIEATDADNDATPGEEPDPKSPHMEWQRHFTLDDKPMEDFMREIQSESNAICKSYYGVDFKEDGITPYAYYIDPCSVLDWEFDECGELILLVLRNDCSVRETVRQVRNTITTTFTVWTRDDQVHFDQYQITYKLDEEPKGETPVPHIAKPKVKLSFKQIPTIICETPTSISVGALIGQAAGSLFARYSTFLFCLNRGLNPILTYKQGSEIPANGDLSVINEDDDRGNYAVNRANQTGKAVIGPDDELTWTEPKGTAYSITQEQLDKDKNELYRLVNSLNSIIGHNGVSTAQTKSSGIAKQIDNIGKEHMLEAYAKCVKEWIKKGFQIIYEALDQDVVWQCKGMDNYKVVDEDALQAKILALPTYKTNIPSKTSYKQVLLDTAYDVHPFATAGVMNIIQQEISDNCDKMDLDAIHQSANPDGEIEADTAGKINKAAPPPKKK